MSPTQQMQLSSSARPQTRTWKRSRALTASSRRFAPEHSRTFLLYRVTPPPPTAGSTPLALSRRHSGSTAVTRGELVDLLFGALRVPARPFVHPGKRERRTRTWKRYCHHPQSPTLAERDPAAVSALSYVDLLPNETPPDFSHYLME